MKGSSVIVLIGLLVVLAGIAMPATQSSTVDGCVEGERGIPGDGYCSGIESSTEVTTRNPTKAPTIIFGILLILVSGVVNYNTGFNGGSRSAKSDTILRASGEVVDIETGETTTLALPVHTDNVGVAIERFKSRCRNEGYEVKGEPDVDVESKSHEESYSKKVQNTGELNTSDDFLIKRWEKADGLLEKSYLVAVGLVILWLTLGLVLGIIGSLI